MVGSRLCAIFGVADGTRTHDDQNHNLGLYQLSYSHRRALQYNPLRGPSVRAAPLMRLEGLIARVLAALDHGATQAEVVVGIVGSQEAQDHATNVIVVHGAV